MNFFYYKPLHLFEFRQGFNDDTVNCSNMSSMFDGNEALGKMDDFVCDISVNKAYLLKEVGNIAFHPILPDSNIALNDHLHCQVVLLFYRD